jgi:acyl carrier protein
LEPEICNITGAKMMTTELEKDITHMLAEVVELDEAELWEKRNQRFVEELGVDSMLALEILALLEKKYRIEIPEENLLDLVSLQSTIDFVDQRLKQRVA